MIASPRERAAVAIWIVVPVVTIAVYAWLYGGAR